MQSTNETRYTHCHVILLYILSEKSLATPNCFAPCWVNVATKKHCISEEFCMKISVVVAAAEE